MRIQQQLSVKSWILLVLSCVICLLSASMLSAQPTKTLILPAQNIGRNYQETPKIRDGQYGFNRDAYETRVNKMIALNEKSSAQVTYLPYTAITAITDRQVHNWYLAQLKVPVDAAKVPDFEKIRATICKRTGATVLIKPTIAVVVDEQKPVMVTLEYWICSNIPGSIDEEHNMISKIDCSFDEMVTDLVTRFLQELPEQIATKIATDRQQASSGKR